MEGKMITLETRTVDFTGSVSSGTMREIDLLNAFLPIIKEHNPLAYDDIEDELNPFCRNDIDKILGNENHTCWQSATMTWVVNEIMWDAMNEIAPEGFYFGAHPGDGRDYGFWAIEEDH
jgi:hypothetical protein